MHICKAVLYNVKCDLKFYRGNHDPVQDFHLRISISLYYGMQSVHGEIKWYQVTHSISHHYVTTGSAAIALHTLAYMCTHTRTPTHIHTFSLQITVKLAPFTSIYNPDTHKKQTVAAADGNVDLVSVVGNQSVYVMHGC